MLYYKSISPVHLVSGDWWPMGGQFNSAPSAVSWGNSRIEIFALDMNNHMSIGYGCNFQIPISRRLGSAFMWKRASIL